MFCSKLRWTLQSRAHYRTIIYRKSDFLQKSLVIYKCYNNQKKVSFVHPKNLTKFKFR